MSNYNDVLQKDQLALARQEHFKYKCRECKWAAADPDGLYCAHNLSLRRSMGFGQGLDKARTQDIGACGPAGLLWEAATEEQMNARNGNKEGAGNATGTVKP